VRRKRKGESERAESSWLIENFLSRDSSRCGGNRKGETERATGCAEGNFWS